MLDYSAPPEPSSHAGTSNQNVSTPIQTHEQYVAERKGELPGPAKISTPIPAPSGAPKLDYSAPPEPSSHVGTSNQKHHVSTAYDQYFAQRTGLVPSSNQSEPALKKISTPIPAPALQKIGTARTGSRAKESQHARTGSRAKESQHPHTPFYQHHEEKIGHLQTLHKNWKSHHRFERESRESRESPEVLRDEVHRPIIQILCRRNTFQMSSWRRSTFQE